MLWLVILYWFICKNLVYLIKRPAIPLKLWCKNLSHSKPSHFVNIIFFFVYICWVNFTLIDFFTFHNPCKGNNILKFLNKIAATKRLKQSDLFHDVTIKDKNSEQWKRLLLPPRHVAPWENKKNSSFLSYHTSQVFHSTRAWHQHIGRKRWFALVKKPVSNFSECSL